ncbi:hypothetical protein Taro_039297 [Colocasia esculenta]|uniref:Uncharacterized protein n=1 Tax=Colocasia esculenta TaxID=4460 RepID=A0A843W8Y8_COLES|nr:hypothetical protein [Colocasia esculenta]
MMDSSLLLLRLAKRTRRSFKILMTREGDGSWSKRPPSGALQIVVIAVAGLHCAICAGKMESHRELLINVGLESAVEVTSLA